MSTRYQARRPGRAVVPREFDRGGSSLRRARAARFMASLGKVLPWEAALWCRNGRVRVYLTHEGSDMGHVSFEVGEVSHWLHSRVTDAQRAVLVAALVDS